MESRVGFQTAQATLDWLALIMEIELIINKYEDTRYVCESHYMGMKKVLNFHHGEDMSDADYLAGFNAKVDVLESHGAEIVVGDSLLKLHKEYRELDWSSNSLTGENIRAYYEDHKEWAKEARDKYIGYILILFFTINSILVKGRL